MLSPVFCIAQQNDVFIRLIDARGQQIKGESVSKGFENWLGATTINAAGKNSTQLGFTMTVNGASADLKRALVNGELLLNGQVWIAGLHPQEFSQIIRVLVHAAPVLNK